MNLLHGQHNGYSERAFDSKLNAHRITARQLRKLADALGLPPGTYDIRSNKAGIAVSGEVTLHAEAIYVQAGGMLNLMARSCKGRKDYVGGHNHFFPIAELEQPAQFADKLRAMMARYIPGPLDLRP